MHNSTRCEETWNRDTALIPEGQRDVPKRVNIYFFQQIEQKNVQDNRQVPRKKTRRSMDVD